MMTTRSLRHIGIGIQAFSLLLLCSFSTLNSFLLEPSRCARSITSARQLQWGAQDGMVRSWGNQGRGKAQGHGDDNDGEKLYSRKDILTSVGLLGTAAICARSLLAQPGISAAAENTLPSVGKITKSGVKYFEYHVGEGPSPKWGQDCVIRFVTYGRPTSGAKLVKLDSSDDNGAPYLFKHGNGRQLRGMEEGIHSMRMGGKRRIVIPKELGYTVAGLGPYPADSGNRNKLANMLNTLEKNEGELVMDVELLDVFDDEADQGYYEDETLTVEELQNMLELTRPFSGGSTFEKLPGQMALPN